jgi:hypothetical protein
MVGRNSMAKEGGPAGRWLPRELKSGPVSPLNNGSCLIQDIGLPGYPDQGRPGNMRIVEYGRRGVHPPLFDICFYAMYILELSPLKHPKPTPSPVLLV